MRKSVFDPAATGFKRSLPGEFLSASSEKRRQTSIADGFRRRVNKRMDRENYLSRVQNSFGVTRVETVRVARSSESSDRPTVI